MPEMTAHDILKGLAELRRELAAAVEEHIRIARGALELRKSSHPWR